MKFEHIKGQEKLFSITLSGISIVLAVLICMKIISYYKLSAKAQNIVDIADIILTQDTNKPGDMDKYLCSTKEIANDLKKSNLFAPPQPKHNPVTQIQCILGNEVFINNKWCKEGEMVQDAKIVKIEPTQVTIEWDGKTKVLSPLGAAIASDGPNERPEPRPENNVFSGPRIVTTAPPSQEQPPKEIASPNIVVNEPPSSLESLGRIDEAMIMEQMKLHNVDPQMLQNMSSEQKEQIQQMIKMQMGSN